MSDLTSVIKDSFIQFSGAVLQNRALVDARDCIKPSARQIFYCMYTDKFIYSKPFQKTLKAIGSAFRLYIHGDSSAEGVIMRAGQPFAMRYPLVEVEGSYGTLLASESWAAPRYTSARLSELGCFLFNDLDKQVIEEWRENYDNTENYPAVLPSKGFFNLVNGSFGLGVGASSSIPQYNLRDLNNALIHLLDNPDCDFDSIYCAPDFATGAILYNEAEVKEAMKNGHGSACKLRSVVEYDGKDNCFIVTEIPYMVYTETICRELEEIINGEDNPGIDRFNDLTGETPLIKIYLEKKANPDRVLKYLFKNTSLQSYYGINFTMLDNGRFPRVFTWKELLQAHIDHEKVVYRRGFEYDLKKINDRIHIINGLITCLANIEEVVKIIKNSASSAAAATELQKRFILDEAQTKAVLDMKLSRLAHLEVEKLKEELTLLQKEAARIENILNNVELFNNELKRGWKEVADKFGDARRTKVMSLNTENDEPIEEKQLSLTFTSQGGIYASETSTLYAQKRNGAGMKFKLDKGESITDNAICSNNDLILAFTNKGNVYHMEARELELDTKKYFSSYIPVNNETIVRVLALTRQEQYLLFVTKKGIVKKSELSEYNLKRGQGIIALKLDDDDTLVDVLALNQENIGICTRNGAFVQIETKDINPLGRVTRGIIGIKLGLNDYVLCARTIPDSARYIISITEDGYVKKTSITEFKTSARGAKGRSIQEGNVIDFMPVAQENEIIVTASKSQIKFKLSEVPTVSLGAHGVKSINLKGAGEKVIKISAI